MTHNFTLPYVLGSSFAVPSPHLFLAWGGAVAGRAVLNGACVCVTATSVTATRDHWVCTINNEGALIKRKLLGIFSGRKTRSTGLSQRQRPPGEA